MAKYLFAYRGGEGMAEAPDAHEKAMAAWGAWFGSLGASVVDGGAPFGESSSVASSGAAGAGGGLGGYSIITAPTMAAAKAATKGCPVLDQGGTVDVYECIDMGM